MTEIRSLQHPLVKHLVKLRHNRDYREEHQTLVLEGVKMVTEVCCSAAPKVLLVLDETLVPPGVKPRELIVVSEEILSKISGTPSPEGVIAEVAMPAPASLKGKERLLALDGVNDPGNLGTLLRTAVTFGFEGLFLFHDCCDPYNDKALRAAKGATFRLPMWTGTWEELKELAASEKLTCYAADLQGTSVNEMAFPKKSILILGNEAHGLSRSVREGCQTVTIPQQGAMDSLNVAVAGGILMYLMARQV